MITISCKYSSKLEISQRLTWAITHKNFSNSFYAIIAESKKTNVWQTDNKHMTDKKLIFSKIN